MAILNLDYYTQVDHYSDGDIEDQMLEMGRWIFLSFTIFLI